MSRFKGFFSGADMFKRSYIFLLIHAVALLALFALRFFGIAADIILLLAAAVISMEAICMALFTKEAAGGTCRTVKKIETDVTGLKESASETVKLQRALLYAGHQIKNIQQELDILKKKAEYKSSVTRRVHHPIVSHS